MSVKMVFDIFVPLGRQIHLNSLQFHHLAIYIYIGYKSVTMVFRMHIKTIIPKICTIFSSFWQITSEHLNQLNQFMNQR